MKKHMIRIFLVASCSMGCLSTVAGTPPVGFVVHFSEGSLGQLDEYGVAAELSNVFVWRLKSQHPLAVDFDIPGQWLQTIRNSKHQAYPIIDTSVFHSSNVWRAREAGAAGQNLIGADGRVFQSGTTTWASLYSPIFRKRVLNYAGQLIDWIKINDPEHKVPAYVDGAEWFMPGMVDYSPLGLVQFQKWLKRKYKDLETLNRQWGSDFKGWNKVDPPRGYALGDGYSGMRTFGFAPVVGCEYVSSPFGVTAGRDYRVQADVLQDGVARGVCGIQLQCFDSDGKPIANVGDGQFYWIDLPNHASGRIAGFCRIPAGAATARMGLKLMGPGTVRFSHPQVALWPSRTNLLPVGKESGGWTLWPHSGRGEMDVQNDGPQFKLSMDSLPLPYQHTGLAWDDWITFSYESMADWLNTCAVYFKEKDPSRKVMSYIGCVFGMATLGDFTTYWQRLDISLANSPDVDVNGIQVCTAGRDYTMVTGPVDLARKYGKPIYLTDIVDFPYGMFSGFDAIYRGTLTSIQHGADGTFAYAWKDSVSGTDYQYLKQTSSSQLKQYVDGLKNAVQAVSGCEIQTQIAFVLPVMPFSLADDGGYKSDWLDMGGWSQLLNDMGLITDFYTPYEITNRKWDLAKYKVIVMPDCPVLPQEVNTALCNYVEQGGIVVGAGRPPSKDLRNQPLARRLMAPSDGSFIADRMAVNRIGADDIQAAEKIMQAVNAPSVQRLGKGKVVWMDEKLGKAYWGQARRGRPHGNTPAVYLKPDYTPEAELLRENIRRALSRKLVEYTPERLVRFDAGGGSISVVPFLKTTEGEDRVVLFAINNGEGRHPATELKLSAKLAGTTGDVWTDFDRHSKLVVPADGHIALPDFNDVVLVTFQKTTPRE